MELTIEYKKDNQGFVLASTDFNGTYLNCCAGTKEEAKNGLMEKIKDKLYPQTEIEIVRFSTERVLSPEEYARKALLAGDEDDETRD